MPGLWQRLKGPGKWGWISREYIGDEFVYVAVDPTIHLLIRTFDRNHGAWIAGCWAKLALEDKIRLSEPAEPIGLSNICFIILRAAGHQTPKLVEDSATYQRICQGPTCRPVGHGFASKSEAKVYCLAAEIEFPRKVFTWSSAQ